MVYADNSALVNYAADSIYTCSQTYDGQPEHYRRIVRNILENGVSTRVSILDVGAALGGLMEAFLQCSFSDVRGISLSQGEVEACQAKNLRAEVCDLVQSSPADLVTVSHVLEHVPDVAAFLHDLGRAARQFIYIEVPDALHYSDYFTSLCQGFNAEHINHFSLSHLLRACLTAGMEIFAQGSYDMAIGGGRRYPAIWVLTKPQPATLRAAITDYADLLERQLRPIRERLRTLPSEIAVWGTGQITQMFLADGTFDNLVITDATDTNPVFHGKSIKGTLIEPPESFRPPSKVPILVCSQLSRDVIIQRIKSLGLTNHLIALDDEESIMRRIAVSDHDCPGIHEAAR